MNKYGNFECFFLKGSKVLKQPVSRRQKTYILINLWKKIMTPLPKIAWNLIQLSRKFWVGVGFFLLLFLPVHCNRVSKLVCVHFYRQVNASKNLRWGVNSAGKVSRTLLKL